MNTLIATVYRPAFLNTVDPFIPEIWAQEGLEILEKNMVAANLVYRNYSDEVASYGDIIHTRRPAELLGGRKVDGDAINKQDVSATDVEVRLNQHAYASFIIYDAEASKSFKDLVTTYLNPAMLSIAGFIDQIVGGCTYQFMGTGSKGMLGTAPDDDVLIDLKQELDIQKCPAVGRNVLLTHAAEGSLLKHTDFVNANTRGDDGSTMRTGHLGRLFGLDFFAAHNQPSIAAGSTTETGANVNNANGYAAGSTTIVVEGGATLVAGSWCTIAGDMTPQKILTVNADPCTSMTIYPGLLTAVVNDAAIVAYTPGAITAVEYAQYHTKRIVVDGFSVAPKANQLLSIGVANDDYHYSVLEGTDATGNMPTTTGILLNDAAQAALSENDVVGIGPKGGYCFGFHPNAIALVMRPLVLPLPSTGVKSAIVSYKGLGIRITISYDADYQGHVVTCDLLCGIKVLDTNLGCVLYTN